MRYADIVLPLAQPLYTFAVAEGVTLCEGMAVVVPFGRSKIYTGIVWRLHDRRPDFKTVKTVSRVLYGTPLLDERQRRFWEWVADYYTVSYTHLTLPTSSGPAGSGSWPWPAKRSPPTGWPPRWNVWGVVPPGSGRRWRSWLPLRPTGRKSPGADSPPIGRLSLSW